MSNEWDKLPNEILALIIQEVASKEDINNGKNSQWMTVNKQWHNSYQSLKYKGITIYLTLTDRPSRNIMQSIFTPGKFVRSVTFMDLGTDRYMKFLPLNGDLLKSFMACCPNVKHVILPRYMDYSDRENDWTQFSTTLLDTNIWKLRTLSINKLSESVNSKVAREHYFQCIYHLCGSIRNLILTEGTLTVDYSCLQGFQQLTSLTIREGVVANLAESCGLLDYLHQLEEITIYFPTFNNSTTTVAATDSTSYPKIHSMHLDGYNISH